MKILFVAPYVPSLIRVRPYNLIRELSRRHEVTVLATAQAAETSDLADLRAMCERVEIVPLRLSVSLRSCGLAALRGDPLQSAYCQMPEVGSRLTDLLATNRYDVAHVEHLRAAFVRELLPTELPRIFDSVDCISLLLDRTIQSSHSMRQRFLAGAEHGRTRRYEARLLRHFDQTIVTSDDDKRALRALAPTARVAVVPNGVNMHYFHPVDGPRDTATIVFTGKMSYHANVTAALHFAREIFPRVRQVRPDARLQIVGSEPPKAVRALNDDPAIEVTGYVADLRTVIGRATVAVCPVTVKVGIQNKVLEAMAMATPVVASRLGATGLLANPGQDFLVANGPADFAQLVCRLIADSSLRQRIGLAGRRFVESHHRWEDAAVRFDELYQEAIVRRGKISTGERPISRVR